MLINSAISTWQSLIESLQIEDDRQPASLEKILQWCQRNIKSDFYKASRMDLTLLFDAYMQFNSADGLDTLIDHELGYTVLHKAAKLGFDRFLDLSLKEVSESIKKQLLQIRTNHGNTPLHLAAACPNRNTVELLVEEYLADCNLENSNHKVPVELAAMCAAHVAEDCVKILLLHTSKDKLTSSFLFDLVAFDNPELLSSILLLKPGLKEGKDTLGQNLLHTAIITNCNRVVEYFSNDAQLLLQITNNESNVMHLACRYGNEHVIHNILDKPSFPGNFLTTKDSSGLIPLDYLHKRPDFESHMIFLGP